MNGESTSRPLDEQFVFNMVWTDEAFEFFSPFLASLIDHSGARFRLVANRCPAREIARMERFAERHPDRVVEVLEISRTEMLSHGRALDGVHRIRDDGPYFCFIDPDILARGEFMSTFIDLLATNAAVTSGAEVWSDGNVLPEGKTGVNGEYFFDHNGYVLGSPHFAIYEVEALDATLEQWQVGFGSGGNELLEKTRARLEEVGQSYWLYDTAKLVNILFQEDGNPLTHVDHPALVHIGGMLHYFSAPTVTNDEGTVEPNWKNWDGMTARYEVAHYTATVLRDLCEGRVPPEVPPGATPRIDAALVMVRKELTDLIATYGTETVTGDRP